MKILIIEPYQLDRQYDIRSRLPGLGPVTVATLLHQAGHEVEVVSEYVSHLDEEDLDDADLVGISITTFNARRGFEIAGWTKKPVVFGGMHASLMPEECLEYGDYVIRGDGHSMVELAACLDHGEGDIRRIPNLAYRSGGETVFNCRTAASLNVIPDFCLVRDHYRFNLNRLLRVPILISASRGCQYRCDFCAVKSVYPDVRKKEVDVVLKDIRTQTKRNRHALSWLLPRCVWITDDNFFADIPWAKEVLRGLAALRTGYSIMIQARVEIAKDRGLLELMRKAGVARVYLGIETLSQESLDAFRKRTTVEEIRMAVDAIKSFDIDVHGLFVFGDDGFMPGDSLRIGNFVRDHSLDGALIQPLTPYPGTQFFQSLQTQGRILHKDWQDYNGKVVFRPRNMTPAQLQREVALCYRHVYSLKQVVGWLFSRKRTPRMAILGDALMRRREARKMEKYAEELLSADSRKLKFEKDCRHCLTGVFPQATIKKD